MQGAFYASIFVNVVLLIYFFGACKGYMDETNARIENKHKFQEINAKDSAEIASLKAKVKELESKIEDLHYEVLEASEELHSG